MVMKDALATYVFESLGITSHVEDWDGINTLPRFLRELYTFGQMELQDRRYITACPLPGHEYTPSAVEKHFDRIRQLVKMDVIFVADFLPPWNRKRFIERKISFIIPGNHMFLPLLGLDLREYVRFPIPKNTTRLNPSTQEIALYIVGNTHDKPWTGAELARERGVSLMTVHRAFDELESTNAFTIRMDGKRRVLTISHTRRDAWEALKSYCTTPLHRTLIIPHDHLPPFTCLAGLSVLSAHSNLVQPEIPEYAVKMTIWNRYLKEHSIPVLPVAEQGAVRIQLWRYEPCFNADSHEANILSVLLSLQDVNDERVAQAIEQILKAVLC